MKYSILIPYYDRPTLKITLQSFVELYSDRNDFEVIICEAFHNFEDEKKFDELTNIYLPFCEKLNVSVVSSKIDSYNCAPCYNEAFKQSIGKYIILTNPESPHRSDVLRGLDDEYSKGDDKYIVCACKNVSDDGSFLLWYQHSVYNPRNLHFCSSMKRETFEKIGGFSEEFYGGICYDDDDLLEKIKMIVPIVTRDDLVVDHIDHNRDYISSDLVEKNRIIYNSKWNRNR